MSNLNRPGFFILSLILGSLLFSGSGYSQAPERDQPRGYQFQQFTLSAGSTFFKYEEPGVMSEEGFLYGIGGNYIQGESNSYGLETTFDLWTGGLEYDGATFADTPVTTSTDDSIFRLSVKGGRFIDHPSGIYFPYIGLGYRFWDDVISATSKSVETTREIEYLYLPVGISVYPRSRGPWYFNGRLEIQTLISGEVLFQDQFTMDQDSGFGGQVILSLNRNLRYSGQVGIELYSQYWDIDESDLSDQTIVIDGTAFSFVEPENTTTMIGLRGTLNF